MHIDAIRDVRAARAANGHLYEEFLRTRSMRAGIYELAAETDDPQRPHEEDELYYVIAGAAAFATGGERRDVAPGDVIFVEAHAEHRFVDITEDLTLLVVFAAGPS